MEIRTKLSGTKLIVYPLGKLNTSTAPLLNDELTKQIQRGVSCIEIDMENLFYISSAGIRVLLSAHKALNGNLMISHANEVITDVFENTGLTDMLYIV